MSGVYRLRELGLGMPSGSRVIRRSEADRLEEADLLIREARRQAERIEADAQAVYESEKARGFAEGQAQAAEEAARRLVEETAILDQKLHEIEDGLCDLVLSSIREILATFDQDTLVREVTRTGLSTMRSEKRVRLHCAPEAEAGLKAALDDLKSNFPEIELIDLIVEDSLSGPNVRIESGLGVVNFVLEDTLSNLSALLKGG